MHDWAREEVLTDQVPMSRSKMCNRNDMSGWTLMHFHEIQSLLLRKKLSTFSMWRCVFIIYSNKIYKNVRIFFLYLHLGFCWSLRNYNENIFYHLHEYNCIYIFEPYFVQFIPEETVVLVWCNKYFLKWKLRSYSLDFNLTVRRFELTTKIVWEVLEHS